MKSRHWAATSVLLALAVCAGCTTRAATDAADAALTEWHIDLRMEGGLRGMSRRIEVDSARGDVLITDEPHDPVQHTLSSVARAELTQLVAVAPTTDVNALNPSCRDCVSFDLKLQRANTINTARYDSSSLSGSLHEAIIKKVASLRNQ